MSERNDRSRNFDPIVILDHEIAELRWAAAYYWGKGQRDEARKAYWELRGLRRARAIVVRAADRLEVAA